MTGAASAAAAEVQLIFQYRLNIAQKETNASGSPKKKGERKRRRRRRERENEIPQVWPWRRLRRRQRRKGPTVVWTRFAPAPIYSTQSTPGLTLCLAIPQPFTTQISSATKQQRPFSFFPSFLISMQLTRQYIIIIIIIIHFDFIQFPRRWESISTLLFPLRWSIHPGICNWLNRPIIHTFTYSNTEFISLDFTHPLQRLSFPRQFDSSLGRWIETRKKEEKKKKRKGEKEIEKQKTKQNKQQPPSTEHRVTQMFQMAAFSISSAPLQQWHFPVQSMSIVAHYISRYIIIIIIVIIIISKPPSSPYN